MVVKIKSETFDSHIEILGGGTFEVVFAAVCVFYTEVGLTWCGYST